MKDIFKEENNPHDKEKKQNYEKKNSHNNKTRLVNQKKKRNQTQFLNIYDHSLSESLLDNSYSSNLNKKYRFKIANHQLKLRPNTRFSFQNSFKLRIPDVNIGLNHIGVPTFDICPDIILTALVAAAGISFFLAYQAITVRGRKKKRSIGDLQIFPLGRVNF